MEELSLDNILEESQIGNLFSNTIEENKDTEETDNPDKDKKEEKEIITEASIEELFDGKPESVGSAEDTGEKDTSSKGNNTSSNFYSSIANALVEDGVLQNPDKEVFSKIDSAESFAEAINDYITGQLDERNKRIAEALDLGLEPTEIQKYERYISTLDGISNDAINDESEQGENLRKNLIYQDCINKGFSKERAIKTVERSFKAGTDIEDAIEALSDNREFYKGQYNSLLKEAKKQNEEEQKKIKEQTEKFRKSLLEEDTAFGEVKVNKSTRQRVYDTIMKPVFTDPETGEKLTAIQKYELENRGEFLKNVGLLYVLTDGFKNIGGLVNDQVKKETKKSLRELENKLRGGEGFHGGSLTLANNSGSNDPESFFKGWKLSV